MNSILNLANEVSEEGVLAGIFAGMVAVLFIAAILLLIYAIFSIVGRWKLYKKCGKGGWEAIVPFYSVWVLLEIAGLKWYYFLAYMAATLLNGSTDNGAITTLCSVVTILVNVSIAYNLQKKFHKGSGWLVLSIFFGGFTIPLLGYSKKDMYDPNVAVSEYAFFGGNVTQPVNPMANQPMVNPMGQPMGMAPQAPMGQPQAPMGQPQAPMGQPQAPMGMAPQAPMGQPQQPMGVQGQQVPGQFPNQNNQF